MSGRTAARSPSRALRHLGVHRLAPFGFVFVGKQFTYRVARLNGEPAVLEYVSGHVFAATFCETDGERILAMYRVLNPEKLTHVG